MVIAELIEPQWLHNIIQLSKSALLTPWEQFTPHYGLTIANKSTITRTTIVLQKYARIAIIKTKFVHRAMPNHKQHLLTTNINNDKLAYLVKTV